MNLSLCVTDLFDEMTNKKQGTPLHYAADVDRDSEEKRTRKVRVFNILCQNGADPFLKDEVYTIIITFWIVVIELSFSQFSFYNLILGWKNTN